MKKKKKWRIPKSTLRERLQRRVETRDDPYWDEPELECGRFRWENLPNRLLRQINSHFFQKSVAAILVVICLGVFSLFNLPLTNRLVDTVHFLTVYQMTPSELVEQAGPVIQTLRNFNWRRSVDVTVRNGSQPEENIMVAPVNGVLISPFGSRLDASGERLEMHYGIDVAADEGSPVYAAFEGVVSLVQNHPLYGLTIYIEHQNNMVTIYGRCAQPKISAGDSVSAGQTLAVVAPSPTGQSHLHFEVWKDGTPTDPQGFLNEPSEG